MIYRDFRKLFPHREQPRTISLIFFVLLFSSHLVGIPQIFTCSLLLRLSAESTPYHVTPGPIGKCAFWVKLWHKPPGFPESWRSYRLCMQVVNIKIKRNTKTKAESRQKPSEALAIMQIYDQNSIMCLLKRSCCQMMMASRGKCRGK